MSGRLRTSIFAAASAGLIIALGCHVREAPSQPPTDSDASAQRGADMPELSEQEIRELRELFAPILVVPSATPETAEGQLARQATTLPDGQHVALRAVPEGAVARWHADTTDWIRTVVRADWLGPPPGPRLYA